MKTTKLLAALILTLTLPVYAQRAGVAVGVIAGPTTPSTCSPSGGRNIFFNTTTGLVTCTATNTWGNLFGGTSTFGGAVLLSDGTAAAPSAAFLSDADGTGTGFWRRAANQIGIAANGTDAFFISNTVIGSASTNTRDLGTSSLFFRHLYTGRIVTGAATPTVAATGHGSTGTVAVTTGSSDLVGMVNLTPAGAGIAASGTIGLTFSTTNGAYGTNPPVCTANLGNQTGTWNARATVIISSPATVSVVFNWDNNAVALTSGQIYNLHYHCIGK